MRQLGSFFVQRGWIGRIMSYVHQSYYCSSAYIHSRIKQQLQNGDLMVAGDHWPLLVYRDHVYDPENPWNGLFRSVILVSVSFTPNNHTRCSSFLQTFKHIFTSPSSVDKEPKATRSGNARIHGMTRVTPPSIAYTATQVSFHTASTLRGVLIVHLG